MVPYIQLFSLALILMTVQILFAPVTNALGKPSISMFSAMSGAILFPASFLIGAQWGLVGMAWAWLVRSEEHTSELQSLMRISYAVFCLKKKTENKIKTR